MSAITKPFVHFTNATTNSAKIFVPSEMIHSAEALDIPAINNTKAKYYIVFTSPNPNGATKEIKIEFATSSARNTSLTNLRTALSTAIA